MIEVVGHLGAENPACTSGVDGPVLDILGVGPHQIGEGSFVGNLDFPIDGSDLIDGLDFGAEPSVDAESLSVDDGSEGKVVEDFGAVFPGIGVAVLPIDLIIKAIDGCYLSAWEEWYLDSWLPLRRVILSGYLTLRHSRYSNVSTEW